MKHLQNKILFCLLILSAIILVWLTSGLWEFSPWDIAFYQHDPDAILFARLHEQSVLSGDILKSDQYGCYPYQAKLPYPPFHLSFMYYFTAFVYTIYPDLPLSSEIIVGILPIIFVFLTAFFIVLAMWKLRYPVKLLLLCAIAVLPGFSASMVSGFLKVDYDFLISFFIWTWLLSAMLYQDTGKDIWKIIGSVIVTLFIATWSGVPLFFFIATIYCFFNWFFSGKISKKFLVYFFSTAIIGSILNILFIINNYPDAGFSLGAYSFFQPVCILIAGVFTLILSKFESTGKNRFFLTVALVAGLVSMIFAFQDITFKATGLLFAKDPVHEHIGELRVILNIKKLATHYNAVADTLFCFGWTIFLFPLFALLPISRFIKNESAVILKDWLVIMILMAFYQIRYIRWISIGAGIYSGIVLFYIWQSSSQLIRDRNYRYLRMTCIFIPLILLHNLSSYSWIHNLDVISNERIALYSWINRNTPETSGYSDNKRPEYSILSYWDEGNRLSYYTKRPVVVGNNMYGYRTMAEVFSAENEKQAYKLCSEYGIKYVLMDLNIESDGRRAGYWSYLRDKPKKPEYDMVYEDVERDPKYRDWFYFWLNDKLGLADNGEFGVSSYFRLVYASKMIKNFGMSNCVMFERVKGAELRLSVEPKTEVSISLGLKIGGRSFLFKKKAESDKDGEVIFTLPYATSHHGGRISTEEFYKLAYIEKDSKKQIKAMVFATEASVLSGTATTMKIVD